MSSTPPPAFFLSSPLLPSISLSLLPSYCPDTICHPHCSFCPYLCLIYTFLFLLITVPPHWPLPALDTLSLDLLRTLFCSSSSISNMSFLTFYSLFFQVKADLCLPCEICHIRSGTRSSHIIKTTGGEKKLFQKF